MTDSLADRITEALNKHMCNPDIDGGYAVDCDAGCGVFLIGTDWERHLASVLVPLVEQAQAEAWDEGREAPSRWAVCPDCLGAGCETCHRPINPYRKDQP